MRVKGRYGGILTAASGAIQLIKMSYAPKLPPDISGLGTLLLLVKQRTRTRTEESTFVKELSGGREPGNWKPSDGVEGSRPILNFWRLRERRYVRHPYV